MSPPHRVIMIARHAAMRSTCSKSKRGAAIVLPDGSVPVAACNDPPAPFACDGWIVEYRPPGADEWVEKARWDCQEGWGDDAE